MKLTLHTNTAFLHSPVIFLLTCCVIPLGFEGGKDSSERCNMTCIIAIAVAAVGKLLEVYIHTCAD